MAGEDKVRGLDIGEAWWQDVDTPEMRLRAEEQMQTLSQFKNLRSLTSASTVSKGGFRGDQN
jgi:dTDP-glucose pyrophosphorylase